MGIGSKAGGGGGAAALAFASFNPLSRFFKALRSGRAALAAEGALGS